MKTFTEQHKEHTHGVLHGFDRLLFRGHFTGFYMSKGIYYYMSVSGVKLTTYNQHVEQCTSDLRTHIRQLAQQNQAEYKYLNSSSQSKEAVAKSIYEKSNKTKGLICVLACLETSPSFIRRGNAALKELEIRRELSKHLHYYLYYMDEEFGWMHVRLQTWFPFSIQIYVNGREYLKHALDKAGLDYTSYDNSITWVSDIAKAQSLSDHLIHKKWDRFLNVFAKKLNIHLPHIEQVFNNGYKWVLHQCEYATDVLFKKRQDLEDLYPDLLQKAIMFRGGEDIYTFFGRNLHHRSTKEVTGSQKRFSQGFRVKHYLDKNSIKMYDKNTVLRVETTINHPRSFKIYKTATRKGQKTKAWVPMGKCVSNLYRYAEIARKANLKYLNSLADVPTPKKLDKNIEQISQSTCVKTRNGNNRRISPFNLLNRETSLLLEAIADARFFIQPFSNKQLRALLIQKECYQVNINDDKELKRFSAKVTRLIAKLKGHKIIYKLKKSFKYKLTKLGQIIIDKLLKFKKIELQTL